MLQYDTDDGIQGICLHSDSAYAYKNYPGGTFEADHQYGKRTLD